MHNNYGRAVKDIQSFFLIASSQFIFVNTRILQNNNTKQSGKTCDDSVIKYIYNEYVIGERWPCERFPTTDPKVMGSNPGSTSFYVIPFTIHTMGMSTGSNHLEGLR